MSHTKTPWHLECDSARTANRLALVVTSNGLRAIDATGSGQSYKEDCANAAFIVQAVNSHAALVEALEEVDAIVSTHDDGKFAASRQQIQQRVRAALAQVTP